MILLVILAILLILGAVLLLQKQDRAEQKRLQERAKSQVAAFSEQSDEIEPTIIATSTAATSQLRRFGTWLGISDAGLYGRRIPLTVVITLALVVGIATSWQATVFFDTLGMLAGIPTAIMILRGIYNWELARNRDRVFNQLPDAVGLMVRAVRAGLPVGEAVRSVAKDIPEPTRAEFQRVQSELAIGVPLDRALWSIHERTQLREYAFLSVVIGLQAQTGGSLTEALENLAGIVRQRIQMTAKAKALASQARASAMILLAMPPVGGLLMALTQEGYTDMLFFDPRGLKLLGLSIGLMLIGALVIRGMLRRATAE